MAGVRGRKPISRWREQVLLARETLSAQYAGARLSSQPALCGAVTCRA